MIKVIWDRSVYEMIDDEIRENGGVPRRCEITGELFTRETWDKMQEEFEKNLGPYLQLRRAEILFEKSDKKNNC